MRRLFNGVHNGRLNDGAFPFDSGRTEGNAEAIPGVEKRVLVELSNAQRLNRALYLCVGARDAGEIDRH